MSDYPRTEVPAVERPYLPDRAFAVIRALVLIYGSWAYFAVFVRYWQRYAPDRSIFAYAPPLANHLTSQVMGVFTGLFVCLRLWRGHRWAYVLTFLYCLGTCVLAVVAQRSMLGWAIALFVSLPCFVFSGLRLLGVLGPPLGRVGSRGAL